MKFSERWLRTLVDPPLDTRGAVRHADDGRPRGRGGEPAAPPFSGVVVGEDRCASRRIPNADRLRVCSVDAGTGAPLSDRLRRAQCRRRA